MHSHEVLNRLGRVFTGRKSESEELRMRQEIADTMASLALPQGEYVLFGSAVLAVHGIRFAGDVDVLVTEPCFDKLNNNTQDRAGWHKQIIKSYWGYTKTIEYRKEANPVAGYRRPGSNEGMRVDLYNMWDGDNYPLKKTDIRALIEDAQHVDGIPCLPLEVVSDWKQTTTRKKDAKDLRRISRHLDRLRSE